MNVTVRSLADVGYFAHSPILSLWSGLGSPQVPADWLRELCAPESGPALGGLQGLLEADIFRLR